MSRSIWGPNNSLAFLGATEAATQPISNCTRLLISPLPQKSKNRPIPGLIFLPPFFTGIYTFALDSYLTYLKLHTLVIISSSTKAKEQTNPWLDILATIFHWHIYLCIGQLPGLPQAAHTCYYLLFHKNPRTDQSLA